MGVRYGRRQRPKLGVFEEDYSWDTKDDLYFPNFTGSEIDFGELSPNASRDHPALHIFNRIMRAHRFIETRTGIDVPEVDVQWPEDSAGGGNNAEYLDDEIFLSSAKQWQESTITHEYGHHFLHNFSQTEVPDYCNGFCDGGAGCPNPGHCMWCPENFHDAWNEGWPNWLADVVTRSYPADYGITSLFGRSLERTGICDQDNDGIADDFDNDGIPDLVDPFKTEGFIGALLRDIEDEMEDQDNNGVDDGQPVCAKDALDLGVDEIFEVVTHDQPITVLQFINAFRARFPEHENALWRTANNVRWEYTWQDGTPPSRVTELVSPTHPFGVGGTSPEIVVVWTAPADEGSGAEIFSYEWSSDPNTVPDFNADPGFSGTPLTSLPLELGRHFFIIRAGDCSGNWQEEVTSFGPYEIIECNDNGIVDLCEVDCFGSLGAFCNVPGCGFAADCNANEVPDDCEIAGVSQDCDLNGVPDECDGGTFVSWIGSDGFWHQPINWDNSDVPGPADHICIDVPTVSTVTHSQGGSEVLGIRSAERFVLSGGTLRTTDRSRMESNFTISYATLDGPGSTEVDGLLSLQAADLRGDGLIETHGGLLIDNAAVTLYDQRSISAESPTSFGGALPWMRMLDNAYFINWDVFAATGGFIERWNGSPRFFNYATVSKTGPDTLDISVDFINHGDLSVIGGRVVLRGGSEHSDSARCLGSPGAVVEFGRGIHSFSPGSRVEAESVVFNAWGGGEATIDGHYDVTGTTTMTGGTITFTTTGSLRSLGRDLIAVAHQGSSVTVHFNNDEPIVLDTYTHGYMADVYFNTGKPVSIRNLTQSYGAIEGGDDIHVSESFLWSGGWQGAYIRGPGQITAAGGMTITGHGVLADDRTLENPATATFTGADAVLTMSGTSEFNNTGIFNAESDGPLLQSGNGLFHNYGTFNKLGPGTMNVGVKFNNHGVVNIVRGILKLSGGTSTPHTGVFQGDEVASLNFVSETFDFDPASTIRAGNVTTESGSIVNVNGIYDVARQTTLNGNTMNFTPASTVLSLGDSLEVGGGTVNLNCDEAIDVQTFRLRGGTVNFNTGQTVTVGQLDQTGGFLSGADEVRASGPSTWTAATMIGAGRTVFENDVAMSGALGLRDSRAVRSLQTASYAGQNTSLNMSGTGGFENAGTFDAVSDGLFGGSGSARFTNTGTFLKRGAGTLQCEVAFHNSGTVELQTGTLEQLYLDRVYTQDAGVTRLNGGQLRSARLDLQGGVLTGTGTLTVSVSNNGGIVRPGLSAGILSIVGSYTQRQSAALEIELNGAEPAAAYDVLNITGSAELDGVLQLELDPAFSPTLGQTFTVMTFGSRIGRFSRVVGLNIGPGLRFDVVYSSMDITLVVVPTASPDLDTDGDVDLDDLVLIENCMTGPGLPYDPASLPAGCTLVPDEEGIVAADLDTDGDVDLADIAILQTSFTGR